MAAVSDLRAILRENFDALSREVAVKRGEISALEVQRDEVAHAFRTVSRLLGVDADHDLLSPKVIEDRHYNRTKPDGIPSMPEMISCALREASERGDQSLEIKDIHRFIAERWWPEVRPTSVSPIAWRLVQEGRLIKEGSAYALPKDDAPAE